MRSPLGALWREKIEVTMIICFVSVTFYNEFYEAQNSVNYYNGSPGAAYLADKTRFDNTDAPVYIVFYPVATPYIDYGGGWSRPYYVGSGLVSYIYHTVSNNQIGIDEIYDSITDENNTSKWPSYSGWSAASDDGHHDPARTPFSDFAPRMTNCKMFIENSDSMNRSDIATDLNALEATLTAAGVEYDETLYSGSGVDENQGRWLNWLANYFGY